jgi:transposase
MDTFKKLRRTRGGSARGAPTRHTGRGVVPRRDAGRTEEQAHISLGQEGLAATGHSRSTYAITYLFGAACPEHGTGAALVLPACNTEAMQLHLNEIATKVTPGALAILILDQAGWHGAKDLKVPRNISLLPLPPRSPELNPQENIWQYMRQNWLSNRVFKSFDEIVDHCCFAWNTLIDQPWKIMSIARRDWVIAGQSL